MSYTDIHLKFADRQSMLSVIANTTQVQNEQYNPDDPNSQEFIDRHTYKYRNVAELGDLDGQGNGWFVNVRLIDGKESPDLVEQYRITVETPCCQWL